MLAAGGMRTNYMRLYGFSPYLEADRDAISIASGGQVALALDFPQEAGSMEYRVLASASGTGPTWHGVDIPLTKDPLLRRSWDRNYLGARASDLRGQLDANGDASAVIRVTAGHWPTLVGRTYHLAAVAMVPSQLPSYSSVAVPLSFVP